MIPENMVIIKMHKFKFEILGAPDVLVGYDDLVFYIDWSDNEGEWTSVAVQAFQEEDGTTVNAFQTNNTFTPGGATSFNRVTFTSTPPEGVRYYKYALIYTRANGEVFTVDPTLMVRRVGT